MYIEEDKLNFEQFEQNIESAVMLYYLNSGANRFSDVQNLPDESAKQRLIQEIKDEIPTKEEINAMLRQYYLVQGRGGYEDYQFGGNTPSDKKDGCQWES